MMPLLVIDVNNSFIINFYSYIVQLDHYTHLRRIAERLKAQQTITVTAQPMMRRYIIINHI